MVANEEIGRRIRLFASLQAAHRALAREAHPSALASLRSEARDLLVRLQHLASAAGADDRIEDSPALSAELAAVDAVLEAQTTRTLSVLDDVDFAQLRALAPTLARDHPEELKGLVDVILEGDLANDRSLRTLEYLITLLSTEEQNGRRQIVREPAALTPRLKERTRQWKPTADVVVVERALENAVTKILQGAELGEVRDRVRQYKEQLGGDLLHPPVLSAVVTYNAAMWNQIAAELESIRSVEDLAAELFEATGVETEAQEPQRAGASIDVLRSAAFGEIATAFGARLHGESVPRSAATTVVEALDLRLFGLEDLEAFDSADETEQGWLIRSTVVLGCLVRNLAVVEEPLRAMEIDPGELRDECVEGMREALGNLARKKFADSNYGEAFRLSEIKRRNLGAERTRPAEAGASSATAAAARGAAKAVDIDMGMQPGHVAWVALAAIILLALFMIPSISERVGNGDTMPETSLEAISPFLTSGVIRDIPGYGRRFVGELGPAWQYVGTGERREVTVAIGEHFSEEGVADVILMDRPGHMAAQYSDGAVVALTPRPGDPAPGSARSR